MPRQKLWWYRDKKFEVFRHFYVPKKVCIIRLIYIHCSKLKISSDRNTNKIYGLTNAPSHRRKISFSWRESRKLSFTAWLATHKRISAGIVTRITLAVNSFTICWSHALPFHFHRSFSSPKSTFSPFVLSGKLSIVRLSSISRRVHFIFANGRIPGRLRENLWTTPSRRELRARDFARSEKYVRPVSHAGFYDLTWPWNKPGGKHILSNGEFFS